MRKYSVGAVLLDKDDPSKVIGRSVEPLLAAKDQDREGYVPNVVYSCGRDPPRRLVVPAVRRGRQFGSRSPFVPIKQLVATAGLIFPV